MRAHPCRHSLSGPAASAAPASVSFQLVPSRRLRRVTQRPCLLATLKRAAASPTLTPAASARAPVITQPPGSADEPESHSSATRVSLTAPRGSPGLCRRRHPRAIAAVPLAPEPVTAPLRTKSGRVAVGTIFMIRTLRRCMRRASLPRSGIGQVLDRVRNYPQRLLLSPVPTPVLAPLKPSIDGDSPPL